MIGGGMFGYASEVPAFAGWRDFPEDVRRGLSRSPQEGCNEDADI